MKWYETIMQEGENPYPLPYVAFASQIPSLPPSAREREDYMTHMREHITHTRDHEYSHELMTCVNHAEPRG